ncbi:regulatory protein RecX [Arthrobacter sp. UM1]|uniref:regulatory protein RecX n=1 Tax=Arthrobacter sp. UM1 TaxID=2766776 RepID=UPI001CF68A81|nr:regulatory protein RecX [Arthrobacter sp. UM1]MCB4208101.1 regulatory protein RecX [Arthrobacter sp. UM1]
MQSAGDGPGRAGGPREQSGGDRDALASLKDKLQEYAERQAAGEAGPDPERLKLEEKARNIATRSLNAAPRTRSQLRSKLLEKEIPEDVADEVLERFEDVGLVDDREFARGWIRARSESKGVASRALREELVKKGVPSDVIEDALVECLEPEREDEFGADLARVKARAVVARMGAASLQSRPEQEKALRKIVAAVARKGHAPGRALGWARTALDEELAEQGAP